MKISKRTLWMLMATFSLATQLFGEARAGIVMSVEPAGAQASGVPGVTTESFNSFSPGEYSSLTTNVGTLTTSGEFSIVGANVYGGAGGVGNYLAFGAQSGSPSPVTLTLNGPESYFGMWWSAADANNELQFYSGSNLLATYTSSSIFASLPGSYNGNPNDGGDTSEKFAYVNFTGDPGTTFTSVVLSNSNTTSTGFESDNFSVAGIAVVPEPSSIVIMGTGAAIVGFVVWKRRRKENTAAGTDVP